MNISVDQCLSREKAETLLRLFDHVFTPSLHESVDLHLYAEKLSSHARFVLAQGMGGVIY